MHRTIPLDSDTPLPLETRLQLQRLRDHLHLLSVLSDPENDEADDLILRRHGLSDCFQTLSERVDTIIAGAAACDDDHARRRGH